jgi:hypothetical protein
MGFKGISLEEYIGLHLKSNPTESKADLKNRLVQANQDFHNGIKCSCGNDIWVIGSASVGNGCFTCITGESTPSEDYELDTALMKRKSLKGRRHIDDMDPMEINGFFTDDGYEINTDLIAVPSLCLTCIYHNDPNEESLCNMTRFDQQEEPEFKCFAYKEINR